VASSREVTSWAQSPLSLVTHRAAGSRPLPTAAAPAFPLCPQLVAPAPPMYEDGYGGDDTLRGLSTAGRAGGAEQGLLLHLFPLRSQASSPLPLPCTRLLHTPTHPTASRHVPVEKVVFYVSASTQMRQMPAPIPGFRMHTVQGFLTLTKNTLLLFSVC
jgi:hypothetical protein